MQTIKRVLGQVVCWERQIRLSVKNHCHFHWRTYFNRATQFEDNIKVDYGTKLSNCMVGKRTVIDRNNSFEKCKIGRYCEIGSNNKNIVGNHPITVFVSISNWFCFPKKNGFLSEKQYFNEYKYIDKEKNWCNQIGNDVYLTNDVTILEGVKIGNGAVVTPGSVVTKNVPAYAIVRGNPAEVVSYRFKKDDIAFLEELCWWDKDEEWIKNHAEYFTNIKLLRKVVSEEKNDNSMEL